MRVWRILVKSGVMCFRPSGILKLFSVCGKRSLGEFKLFGFFPFRQTTFDFVLKN